MDAIQHLSLNWWQVYHKYCRFSRVFDSSWQDAEGWVGTIKRECLDHFFIFGEAHFKYLVKEFVKYYNTVRPHSSMNNMPLDYKVTNTNGKVRCESGLGGMIKHYYRE